MTKQSRCREIYQAIKQVKSTKVDFDSALQKGEIKECASIQKVLKEIVIKAYEISNPTIDEAMEIMTEESIFGPDKVKQIFGIELSENQIPRIPFSREELKRAKELGQVLILRIDKSSDGERLDLVKMDAILKAWMVATDKTDFIDWNNSINKDSMVAHQVPRSGWALASMEILDNSDFKDYLGQTEFLVEHLKDVVFKGVPLPPECKKAIEEFEREKPKLEELLTSNLSYAARKMAWLEISELYRKSAIEVLYDMAITTEVGDSYKENFTWTKDYHDNWFGGIIVVEVNKSLGVNIKSMKPNVPHRDCGIPFTRSK